MTRQVGMIDGPISLAAPQRLGEHGIASPVKAWWCGPIGIAAYHECGNGGNEAGRQRGTDDRAPLPNFLYHGAPHLQAGERIGSSIVPGTVDSD